MKHFKLLSLLLISTAILSACSKTTVEKEQATDQTLEQLPIILEEPVKGITEPAVEKTGPIPGGPAVVQIDMIAKQWEFEPAIIKVNKGDLVRLNIKSIDVKHGISIPDLGIKKELKPNTTTLVEFIADQAGEFNFNCSVFCGAGHIKMVGKIIVK